MNTGISREVNEHDRFIHLSRLTSQCLADIRVGHFVDHRYIIRYVLEFQISKLELLSNK